jgi:RyR domain
LNDDIGEISYQPAPIDTSQVELTDDLKKLIEILAENAHDTWAIDRFEMRWRYGPCRDDAKRLHPGLVPYAELSEREKDIDRDMVVATIRAVIALGYVLRKTH